MYKARKKWIKPLTCQQNGLPPDSLVSKFLMPANIFLAKFFGQAMRKETERKRGRDF